MSAFFHISNWPGVVGLCTTRFNWGRGGSNWPGIVGLCTTRFSWGRERGSNWPGEVGLCTTRFNWGRGRGLKLTWCSKALYISSVDTLHLKIWGHSALGHQMSLLGVTSHLRVHFIWKDDFILLCMLHLKDDLILLLATRCHYWGDTSHLSIHFIWKYELISGLVLHHRGLFYERPTNNEL